MLRLATFVVLTAALLPSAFAVDTSATVAITNKSSWALHNLYISSVDDEEWGKDQLGDAVIESGESFTLNNIPCDAYDVRLVDEDGDECIINAVALCADKEAWVINDTDLLACQAASEE